MIRNKERKCNVVVNALELYACLEIQFVDSLSRSLKAFEANIFFFFLFSQKNLAFCHLSVCSVSGIQKTISTYYETAKGHKESKSNSGHFGSSESFISRYIDRGFLYSCAFSYIFKRNKRLRRKRMKRKWSAFC